MRNADAYRQLILNYTTGTGAIPPWVLHPETGQHEASRFLLTTAKALAVAKKKGSTAKALEDAWMSISDYYLRRS